MHTGGAVDRWAFPRTSSNDPRGPDGDRGRGVIDRHRAWSRSCVTTWHRLRRSTRGASPPAWARAPLPDRLRPWRPGESGFRNERRSRIEVPLPRPGECPSGLTTFLRGGHFPFRIGQRRGRAQGVTRVSARRGGHGGRGRGENGGKGRDGRRRGPGGAAAGGDGCLRGAILAHRARPGGAGGEPGSPESGERVSMALRLWGSEATPAGGGVRELQGRE